MKNVWKRTLSLMLSGVLLLGSVPMGAFATEQTQEPTELVEEIQPVVAVVKNEVALTQNPAVDMSIVVNGGEQITSDKKDDLLGDGKLSYDNTNRILTLKGATVETILLLGNDISEIRLEEGTENTISTSLVTNQCGIKITGKGTLNVGTVEVAGNLEIVDAVVNAVGIEGEKKTLIKIQDTITVSGVAHLTTASGYKAVVFNEDEGKIKGNGYVLVGEVFAAINGEKSVVKEIDSFELIANDHLKYEASDTKHWLVCVDSCDLNSVKIQEESHSKEQENDRLSGCGKKAYCSKCKLEYGTESSAHLSTQTKFVEENDTTHKKVYACCEEIVTPGISHNPEYQSVGAAITAVCTECGADGSATLKIEGGKENVMDYTNVVEKKGIMSDVEITPAYKDKAGNALSEAPQTYGQYVVTIEIAEKTASASYNITRDITTDDVMLGDTLTYTGAPQSQTVLKKDSSSDVTFVVENNTQTDAGQYTLIVKGSGLYSDGVNLDYTIAKSNQYSDATIKTQTVVLRKEQSNVLIVDGLKKPAFTGVTDEEMTGKITYSFTYDDITETVDESQIENKIKGMEGGETATLKYDFTPEESGNYTGSKTGSIEITVVMLELELNGEEATVDKIKKQGDITYGDPDIITVSELVAKANGVAGEKGTGFTVKYAKISSNGTPEAEQTDSPSAGSNEFYVYYSGTIGEHSFEKALVLSDRITVKPKTPAISDSNKPKAEHLCANADGSALPLIKDGNEGKTDDGAALEYRLGNTGDYKQEIPTVTASGYYEVYYRTPHNGNYVTPGVQGKLQILVLPYLTATYGQTLDDIKDQLPQGFEFDKLEYPLLTEEKVGEVGEPRIMKIEYDHGDLTVSNLEAPLKINPKLIKAITELEKTHYVYDAAKEIKPVPKVTYINDEGNVDFLPSTQYTYIHSDNKYPGRARVSISSKNYAFTEDSVTTVEFIIYRPGPYELSIVPETLELLYESKEELQKALEDGLEKKHQTNDKSFYNIKMREYDVVETDASKQWKATDEEFYCPEDGFSFSIKYPKGTNKETKFEAVGINTMKNAENRDPEPVEIVPKNETIEFKMKGYAAVCLAWNGYDDNSTFKITTSATNGKVKFTVGEDTTTKEKADAVKVGEKITITPKPNSNYAVTGVSYTYNSGAFSVKVEQNSSGKYVIDMPPMDINITADFEKKTTNTKNPHSGDSSNIYLWVVILAASGAAIGALMAFWFKKRKK